MNASSNAAPGNNRRTDAFSICTEVACVTLIKRKTSSKVSEVRPRKHECAAGRSPPRIVCRNVLGLKRQVNVSKLNSHKQKSDHESHERKFPSLTTLGEDLTILTFQTTPLRR